MSTDIPSPPGLRQLTNVSARIGLLSFGGPAGQVALMHRELVEERGWIGEEDFLHALNLCHLLPGPEAQQLASWAGWRLHGWKGGLIAGGLFVLPGAIVMLGLSMLYVLAADLGWFAALFTGIKAAVLAIVAQALLRISGRALKTAMQRGLALAAFLALALLDVPFPLVVLGALVMGVVVGRTRPDWLGIGAAPVSGGKTMARPWGASLRAIGVWAAVWAVPIVAVFVTLGPDHVLWDIAVFFSQLAVVTFGGAYAVLAYMAQEAVSGFGWLRPGEMIDGLGLAETTPGPLILVTQFVGFIGAYRAPDPFTPMVAGLLGAGLTLWVTFAPCFLWIFAFAPWMDHLQRAPALRGGLAAVTAAVVGVIANLALWFAVHVLFARVGEWRLGPFALELPDPASIDWRAAVIAAAAMALVFVWKRGIFTTLAVCGALGLALSAL